MISFLTVQRGAGEAPRNGARRSTSRGNSEIFARPGHKSEGRILLPATAPMKTTSNCHRAPKAPIRLMPLAPKATCICRRNCILLAIHLCMCELINMVVCETLMIYICMIGSTRNYIYIYMHNVYNV